MYDSLTGRRERRRVRRYRLFSVSLSHTKRTKRRQELHLCSEVQQRVPLIQSNSTACKKSTKGKQSEKKNLHQQSIPLLASSLSFPPSLSPLFSSIDTRNSGRVRLLIFLSSSCPTSSSGFVWLSILSKRSSCF